MVDICKPENSGLNMFGHPRPEEAVRKVALCVFPDIMTLLELMIHRYDMLYAMTHP